MLTDDIEYRHFLTPRQVAKAFDVCLDTVTHWVAEGRLVATPFGSGPKAPLMFLPDDNPQLVDALERNNA